jgi:D-arginine dehydrogenase
VIRTDIAIIGAGMAGASLAAMIDGRARCTLIEAEDRPGYHATGRSAAFWSETYGGPLIQPLTSASHQTLDTMGVLHPRGCLHIADMGQTAVLDRLAANMAKAGVPHAWLDRTALTGALPGLHGRYERALVEPTCSDIDVAALHAAFLRRAAATGARLLTDAAVTEIGRRAGEWRIATRVGEVRAEVIVDAAGAWADPVAQLADVPQIGIRPYRRTVVQIEADPAPSTAAPLVMDAAGSFYFKPDAGGKLWLSPHDETPVVPHDVAPEEWDVALAIERFENAGDWKVVRRDRAWAGLRSFAPDRLPVYGFDTASAGFFWCAGQGGFGIQTAPAAAMLCAALLLGDSMPAAVSSIDAARYAPGRFA